jgi:hypothetical protein
MPKAERQEQPMIDYEVIVIGAGVAGILSRTLAATCNPQSAGEGYDHGPDPRTATLGIRFLSRGL